MFGTVKEDNWGMRFLHVKSRVWSAVNQRYASVLMLGYGWIYYTWHGGLLCTRQKCLTCVLLVLANGRLSMPLHIKCHYSRTWLAVTARNIVRVITEHTDHLWQWKQEDSWIEWTNNVCLHIVKSSLLGKTAFRYYLQSDRNIPIGQYIISLRFPEVAT